VPDGFRVFVFPSLFPPDFVVFARCNCVLLLIDIPFFCHRHERLTAPFQWLRPSVNSLPLFKIGRDTYNARQFGADVRAHFLFLPQVRLTNILSLRLLSNGISGLSFCALSSPFRFKSGLVSFWLFRPFFGMVDRILCERASYLCFFPGRLSVSAYNAFFVSIVFEPVELLALQDESSGLLFETCHVAAAPLDPLFDRPDTQRLMPALSF